MSQSCAISSQRSKCVNLAQAETNAYETVGNRPVNQLKNNLLSVAIRPGVLKGGKKLSTKIIPKHSLMNMFGKSTGRTNMKLFQMSTTGVIS